MDDELYLRDFGLEDTGYFALIEKESDRQIEKWGYQTHSIETWYLILSEEFGELGKAILEKDIDAAIEEASQVSALAIKIAIMLKEFKKQLIAEGNEDG